MAKFSAGSSGKTNRVIDLRKWKPKSEMRSSAHASLTPRRVSTLRTRRRKLRALIALVLVVVVAGFVEGVSSLSYADRLSIGGITIAGTKDVPLKLVRAYVETKLYDGTRPLFSRDNIFLYPKASIEKSVISFFPRIRSADISRETFLANALTVTVAERQSFAFWCSDAVKCYEMDEGGFVFADSPTSTPHMGIVFRGGLSASTTPIGETYLPTHFPGILELFKRLREAGFAPEGATVLDDQDFSVSFDEGFILRASFGSDATALVRNLQLALSAEPLRGKVNKLEYVDLRFGNRVYYKNKQ